MTKKLFVTIFFVLALMPVYSQEQSEKKEVYSRLEIKRELMESFFRESLADSIAGLFSPNCHMAMEFGPLVESRDDVQEYLAKDFLKGKEILKFELDPEEKKIYDDLILELGTCTIEYTRLPEKKLYRSVLNYMFVWKKAKDDSYRLRAAIWNSSKDPCR